MGKTATVAITEEQYKEIVATIRNGFLNHRSNERVAMALILQANLGLRVSDIVKLTPNSFIKDGERYRIDIIEKKTGKTRKFTVPTVLYNYIMRYAIDNEIKSNDRIFPMTSRNIQAFIKDCVDYLGYNEMISTHSFRKFYATNIYMNNDYNLLLVQELLQHASPTTTQKYIGIGTKALEKAIQDNLNLL